MSAKPVRQVQLLVDPPLTEDAVRALVAQPAVIELLAAAMRWQRERQRDQPADVQPEAA